MNHSINIVDVIIQKKFKEILDAKKQGKLYDFRLELKKELEAAFEKLHSPDTKKEVENLLQELTKQKFSNDWMN